MFANLYGDFFVQLIATKRFFAIFVIDNEIKELFQIVFVKKVYLLY